MKKKKTISVLGFVILFMARNTKLIFWQLITWSHYSKLSIENLPIWCPTKNTCTKVEYTISIALSWVIFGITSVRSQHISVEYNLYHLTNTTSDHPLLSTCMAVVKQMAVKLIKTITTQQIIPDVNNQTKKYCIQKKIKNLVN